VRHCSFDDRLFIWETDLEYSDNIASLSGITELTMVTSITMTVITMTVIAMVTGITAGNSYQKRSLIIHYAKSQGLGKNNDSTCQPRISVNLKGWKLLMNDDYFPDKE